MKTEFSPTVLEDAVLGEMRDWGITGVSLALIADGQILYAQGFGGAARGSIFRAGSISKLFNAVAVMQMVESGKLNLDEPIPPVLLPLNPYLDAPPVTLRQLLCHRSGLQREAPVGGYFDDSGPGLAVTVSSVRPCVLATAPGAKTRYSNIGPSMAGYCVERASGKNFAEFQHDRILAPLGMAASGWTIDSVPESKIIKSWMRVADGCGGWIRRPAPLFDLGTIPAGNLFTCVDDLACFALALLSGGGLLLWPESLAEMWRPQLTGESAGYGLGFMVGEYKGHRMVSHGGAVYGHSALFALLPDLRAGVIILSNEDIANGRVRRLADLALSQILPAQSGEASATQSNSTFSRDPAIFAGHFESESFWAEIWVRNGRLEGNMSGQPTRFERRGELEFSAESRIDNGAPVVFEPESGAASRISGFHMGLQHFCRVLEKPRSLPPEWKDRLGTYGPDFIPVVVSERHGHLYAMTENMVDYRLTPINRHACALPLGMYTDEHVVFLTDEGGRTHAINFANMILRRKI